MEITEWKWDKRGYEWIVTVEEEVEEEIKYKMGFLVLK